VESDIQIRVGRPDDLPRLVEIYNHYVESSHVTFDTTRFQAAEREPWFGQFQAAGRYRLWVAADAQRILGYACSTPFKPKSAYAISVETTIYMDAGRCGAGVGTRLYRVLLESLTGCDIHGAYGAIALPNPASEALHRRLGFRPVGTLQEVGRKFDKLWSVAWYEKRI
jgi:phosphinothricin acetyltransferase